MRNKTIAVYIYLMELFIFNNNSFSLVQILQETRTN